MPLRDQCVAYDSVARPALPILATRMRYSISKEELRVFPTSCERMSLSTCSSCLKSIQSLLQLKNYILSNLKKVKLPSFF